jgi:hypothetical protein
MSHLCPICGAPPIACAIAACDPGGGERRLSAPVREWPRRAHVGDILESRRVPGRRVEVYRVTDRGVWWRLLDQGQPSGGALEPSGWCRPRNIWYSWELANQEESE